MDINFHYFAVKTIAIEAGFDPDEAQLIASYSQFVDDYSIWENYKFKRVPKYAMELATKKGNYYKFYTVTTGFESLPDMTRLKSEKYQKEIVVPFHFIPYKNLKQIDVNVEGREAYRTSPADHTGDNLMDCLMKSAMQKCKDSIGTPEYHYALIRLGLYLHVFADTYAHDNFSGFKGWENYSYIKNITRTDTGAVIHDDISPDILAMLPAIGHGEVGHAPDMTCAHIEYSYAVNKHEDYKTKYSGGKTRTNTKVFEAAAHEIYKILYIVKNGSEPSTESWNALQTKIHFGFMVEGTDFDTLRATWRNSTGGNIDYSYRKESLWQDQLVKLSQEEEALDMSEEDDEEDEDGKAMLGAYETASDDFFHYNVFAKQLRDAVIE